MTRYGAAQENNYDDVRLTISLARSAIMMVGALVLPEVIVGMIEASITRRRSMPRTLKSVSTTALGSFARPILHVPTG